MHKMEGRRKRRGKCSKLEESEDLDEQGKWKELNSMKL